MRRAKYTKLTYFTICYCFIRSLCLLEHIRRRCKNYLKNLFGGLQGFLNSDVNTLVGPFLLFGVESQVCLMVIQIQ